ncbi:GGDEF domain-containing protein [Psychromonas ingrahamii]|nr:GGDEF domain-containing protein [Psychromonas ingrahamii]
MTVSIGCAVNDGSCSLEETPKVADQALYWAKENGRNQISFVDKRME